MRGNGVEQLPRVQWRKRARSRDDYAQTSAICSVCVNNSFLAFMISSCSSRCYPMPPTAAPPKATLYRHLYSKGDVGPSERSGRVPRGEQHLPRDANHTPSEA
eukprot:834390-Pyramimonas_sp.AAC.1